jgi:ribosomal protein S18 acetylase RimI-like enzyme
MSDLVFRRANRTDLPAIIALLADDEIGRTREDSGTPSNPRHEDAFRAIDQDPNQFFAIVEKAGTTIGCLQLTFIPGLSRLGMWRGQIESVRVAKSHRGQSLGDQMLNWAIETCRQHHCGLVQLTTDVRRLDARRFYEKHGFKASHAGMKLDL